MSSPSRTAASCSAWECSKEKEIKSQLEAGGTFLSKSDLEGIFKTISTDAKSKKWAKQKQFATQMREMKHGTQSRVGFGAGGKGLFKKQMIGVDVG